MSSSTGYAGYCPSYECSDTLDLGDWLSSPVLDPPDWPIDNGLNDEYTNSPLSSPGMYAPQGIGSQNYFDRPFPEATQPSSMASPSTERNPTLSFSYPQIVPQPEWNSNRAQGNIQLAPSYVPLSLIHDPPTQVNDNETNSKEDSLYSPGSRVTFTGESPPPVAFRRAWGTTKDPTSRRHSHSGSSRSGRHSSLLKVRGQPSPPTGAKVSGSSKGPQLRSTRTGHKIIYSEPEDAPRSENTKNSKTSHNMVEKQYRIRLNGQFSTLLEALPPGLVGAEVEGYGRIDSGGDEKKVSKAEVLMLAKRYIEGLEWEKRGLEGRNDVLLEDIHRLKRAWADMGGQILP